MKPLNTLFLLLPFVLCCENQNTQESQTSQNLEEQTPPFIEILSDEARQVIDPDQQVQILAKGFLWSEGPLWIEEGSFLLFSDIPRNKVFKWMDGGDTSTYLHPSGFSGENYTGREPGSNGLLLNPEGDLVLMQHGNRQVAKMDADLNGPVAQYTTIVSKYDNKRFNSPNDGCYDQLGNLYFTDPPYGLAERMEDPAKELDYQGIYCFMQSGELRLLDQEVTRPNGIALSPDERTLYVAVSDPEHAVWYAYEVEQPGQVSNKRLLFDATNKVGEEFPGLPDGLKVNDNGYIFATGPGGVLIFNPQGDHIAQIHLEKATANCAFDYTGKRLFITSSDQLMEVAIL